MLLDRKSLPKIELHCHLDGSLSLEIVQKLLRARGESHTLAELEQLMRAPEDCADLSEYLQRFDLPNQVLQTREELAVCAFDLAEQAAKENVKYIEVRFAPKFSTAEGLSVPEVLAAVEEGLARAREQYDINTGIIVCGMRGLSEKANLTMLHDAMELYGAGVVACDLAGDEKAYPVTEFGYFFEQAAKYGIPYTIHAGECGSRENIRDSIAMGAGRIGHGIAMLGDHELQKMCAQRRIGVELCPTSNLQTKALSDFRKYPFEEFYKAGVPLSINTDNRTVSGTNLTREIERIARTFVLTGEMYDKIYRDSVECSFANDDVKHNLLCSYFSPGTSGTQNHSVLEETDSITDKNEEK